MTLTDEEIDNIWRATEGHWNFARAIEARVHEELRKQKPFAWIAGDDCRDATIETTTPPTPTPSADTWSGTMEVCRVRGTHGRADYITTGNRMDNRCNLRVTFNGSELIKAEIARPPNTPDGLCMFAVIGMPTPPEGSGK